IELLFGQIADALDAVHHAGMIHRDVKPANVLIERRSTSHRPTEFAYLTHFGPTPSPLPSNLTQAGVFCGSIDYASTEQLRGSELKSASHVSSYTVMLYEALTGRRPFNADSDTGVMYAQVFEAAAPVSSLRPGLPAGVDEIVAAGLAKDAE